MKPIQVANLLAVMNMPQEAECIGRMIAQLDYYMNESKSLQEDLVRMTHRAVRAEQWIREAHELCEAISLGVISRNNAENLAGELDVAMKQLFKEIA